jgi:hypothetical protein
LKEGEKPYHTDQLGGEERVIGLPFLSSKNHRKTGET